MCVNLASITPSQQRINGGRGGLIPSIRSEFRGERCEESQEDHKGALETILTLEFQMIPPA